VTVLTACRRHLVGMTSAHGGLRGVVAEHALQPSSHLFKNGGHARIVPMLLCSGISPL
jgi:hypothetical protein